LQDPGADADFVTTKGAQTIAGDKTFSGALTPSGGIVGKTDGVAVAAGYVGEILTAGAETTYANIAANQVNTISRALSKGTYLVSLFLYIRPATEALRGLGVKLTAGTEYYTPSAYNTNPNTGPITVNADTSIPQCYSITIPILKTVSDDLIFTVGNLSGNPTLSCALFMKIIRIA
jgi:hypothetical protein